MLPTAKVGSNFLKERGCDLSVLKILMVMGSLVHSTLLISGQVRKAIFLYALDEWPLNTPLVFV